MKKIENIEDYTINKSSSIRDALAKLNTLAFLTLLIVDDNKKLLGTITDGDVRRAFLRDVHVGENVTKAMHDKPVWARVSDTPEAIEALMIKKDIMYLPVVGDDGILISLYSNDSVRLVPPLTNEAVIMCGGLGTRLGPLTKDCPKPMLKVGNKPILERILTSLIDAGLRRFYFAINYLGHMIEEHFGNGEKWGVEIEYLCENERLGTGGALSLLPRRPTEPLLVINGDILTRFNIKNLFDFHNKLKGIVTMGITAFEYQNPYGVVLFDSNVLIGFEEKPVTTWFINSGIYVIEPELLDFVPPNTFIDMPSILTIAQQNQKIVNVCPICEGWLDIGRISDYNLAQAQHDS